jgi:hypothetical protein
MLKFKLIGASILLVIGVLLLVPPIQKSVASYVEKYIPRWWLSMVAVICIVAWVYIVVPRLNFALGVTFVCVSLVMILAAPKNHQIASYVSEMFFSGNDIFDKNAPYAEVVDLFRYPLLGLGIYVICQQMMIILDLMPITWALYLWRKRIRCAEDKLQGNSNEQPTEFMI